MRRGIVIPPVLSVVEGPVLSAVEGPARPEPLADHCREVGIFL